MKLTEKMFTKILRNSKSTLREIASLDIFGFTILSLITNQVCSGNIWFKKDFFELSSHIKKAQDLGDLAIKLNKTSSMR